MLHLRIGTKRNYIYNLTIILYITLSTFQIPRSKIFYKKKKKKYELSGPLDFGEAQLSGRNSKPKTKTKGSPLRDMNFPRVEQLVVV